MALAEVIGTYNGASGPSIVITTTAPVAAGETILVLAKQGAATSITCTDSAGNSYLVGTGGQRFNKTNAAALPSGGTITLSYTATDYSFDPNPFTHVALRLSGVTGSLGEVPQVGVFSSNPTQSGGQITIGSSPTAGSRYLMIGWADETGDATFVPTADWTTVHNADGAVAAYREETTNGTYKWEGAASMTTGFPNSLGLWLRYIASVADAVYEVSQARAFNGKLCLAYLDSAGAVKVNRYSDAAPPAVAATVTVEASGGTGVSLLAARSGQFDLMYALSGTIKRRFSTDAGRSFGVATTVATGYQDVCHLVDEARGITLAAVWLQASSAWYLTVGTLNSGGTAWSYTTPALLVSSANRGGSFLRRADGTYEFAYTTTGNTPTIIRCSSLSKAGTGTFS